MWWYFVVIIIAIVVIGWFYFNYKIKKTNNYLYIKALTIAGATYLLDNNINWIIEWINNQYSLNLPLAHTFGNMRLFVFLLFIIIVLFLFSKTQISKKRISFKKVINKCKQTT